MEPKKTHVFEHLGKPPYRYAGFAELIFVCPGTGATKAGGSCDHCGTAICNAFYFTSDDGKTFKVGSSCVTKSGDKGLRKFVSEEQRKAKAAKEKASLPGLREDLAKLIEEKKPELVKLSHPYSWCRHNGLTYHDYFTDCARQAGFSKVKKLIRELNSIKGV
jgi:hypothetical protein